MSLISWVGQNVSVYGKVSKGGANQLGCLRVEPVYAPILCAVMLEIRDQQVDLSQTVRVTLHLR